MKIEHIGTACADLESTIEQFKKLGFSVEAEPIVAEPENLLIAMLVNGDYRIELIAPNDKNQPTAIDAVIETAKSSGTNMYHICYRTADIEADVSRHVEMGFSIVMPPREAIAFGGKKAAFLSHPEAGLIELAELD